MKNLMPLTGENIKKCAKDFEYDDFTISVMGWGKDSEPFTLVCIVTFDPITYADFKINVVSINRDGEVFNILSNSEMDHVIALIKKTAKEPYFMVIEDFSDLIVRTKIPKPE